MPFNGAGMGSNAMRVSSLGSYYQGNPFVGEYFTRKDNPANLTEAQANAIDRNLWPGQEIINQTRSWYGGLMPGGQWTAQPNDWAQRYGHLFNPPPDYPR